MENAPSSSFVIWSIACLLHPLVISLLRRFHTVMLPCSWNSMSLAILVLNFARWLKPVFMSQFTEKGDIFSNIFEAGLDTKDIPWRKPDLPYQHNEQKNPSLHGNRYGSVSLLMIMSSFNKTPRQSRTWSCFLINDASLRVAHLVRAMKCLWSGHRDDGEGAGIIAYIWCVFEENLRCFSCWSSEKLRRDKKSIYKYVEEGGELEHLQQRNFKLPSSQKINWQFKEKRESS